MANSTVNLLRNTKVFYTTLEKAAAQTAGNINPGNTWEIQVLSDFTFSQGTEQQTITLNEAGATPTRGQRSFNTAINPVDWSFGTYVRPYKTTTLNFTTASGPGTVSVQEHTVTASAAPTGLSTGDYVTWGAVGGFVTSIVGTTVKINQTVTGTPVAIADATTITRTVRTTAPEALLWNAIATNQDPYVAVAGTNAWTEAANKADLSFANSNTHRFTSFGLIFKVDNTVYYVSDCAVNQADINFGIDQIAQVAWSGQGTDLVKLDNSTNLYSAVAGTGALDKVGAANTWDSTAPFITNKLSIVSLEGYNIKDAAGVSQDLVYDLAITGGQLTINNNITFLTPETLGAVNKPIGYFSGTRAISGNLTCYLRVMTVSGRYASELLDDLVTHSLQSPDNLFKMVVGIGSAGLTTGDVAPHLELTLPAAMLQIPTVDVQDVVSATINFTAQGSSATATVTDNTDEFDILESNDLFVTYRSVAA